MPNYGRSLSERVVNKILEDRERNGVKYTDSKIFKMITRRLKTLMEIEGKDIWYDSGVFFIDDETDPMGIGRYVPSDKEALEIVQQIKFLIQVIESF